MKRELTYIDKMFSWVVNKLIKHKWHELEYVYLKK